MKHKILSSKNEQHDACRAFESKDEYESVLEGLQKELLDLQQKIRKKKRKVVVIFEGADASGKGGAIKRLTEYLDPREFRVAATGAPSEDELKQNYMQRFFRELPQEGTITIFDRSWYGRVLVERVEGLIPPRDWKRAYHEINAIEKMLVADGTIILKYFLDVTYGEQKRRFEERETDPLKKWKLTDDDWRNRAKWTEYHRAFRDMVKHTSTKHSPWKILAADSKWFARTEVLRDFVSRVKRSLR